MLAIWRRYTSTSSRVPMTNVGAFRRSCSGASPMRTRPLAVALLAAFASVFALTSPPEWGRVFIFSGATGAMIRKIVPTSEFFAFGFSLAALGDVNGDGIPDLAVGAPEFLNNRWGEVYAFSGATGAQLWVFREPP